MNMPQIIFHGDEMETSEERRAYNREWYKNNRERSLKKHRQWNKLNRKKLSERQRLNRHKMTKEEHDRLLKEQDNSCAICRNVFMGTPIIDHCHRSGINRALLCDNCNKGLGHFRDSCDLLQEAISYLRKFERLVSNGTIKAATSNS